MKCGAMTKLHEKSKKKILIAGLGSIGKRYKRNFETYFKKFEIVDFKKYKNKKNPQKKIFAAIISNPTSHHIGTANQLVAKNIHCLIEKPLSLNFSGIKKLKKISKSKNLNIQVGYNLRFLEGGKFLKKKIINEKNKINHVIINCFSNLKNWRKNLNYKKFSSAYKHLNGGVVYEFSHEIDYLRWFFGEVDELIALVENTKKLKLNISEVATIFIKLRSGFTANINLSLISKFEKRDCTIMTSKNIYKWDLLKDRIFRNDKLIFKSKNKDINLTQIKQLKNFFNSIKKVEKPMVSLSDSIETLKILLAIEKSSKLKKFIKL